MLRGANMSIGNPIDWVKSGQLDVDIDWALKMPLFARHSVWVKVEASVMLLCCEHFDS